MPTLPTWGGYSMFDYSGSVASGTKIIYGKSHVINVSGPEYAALLGYFKGLTVPVGPSFTLPPGSSLGHWLQANVTKTAIASYVAPILVSAGCAVRVGKDIKIP
jgi:hypothetical protein